MCGNCLKAPLQKGWSDERHGHLPDAAQPFGLQPLLQGGVVRVQLFQLRQQDLYVLQLAIFLPVLDQQHTCPTVRRIVLDDLHQLFLGRF